MDNHLIDLELGPGDHTRGNLDVWDNAGHDAHHRLRRFSYTDADMTVPCYGIDYRAPLETIQDHVRRAPLSSSRRQNTRVSGSTNRNSSTLGIFRLFQMQELSEDGYQV